MRSWLCFFLLICSFAAFGEGPQSVLVKTGHMNKETMTFTLSGYGTLFSDPGYTINIDQPRAGQITHMVVTAGQTVKRGNTLFQFATDPGAANNYAQAESALEMAKNEYESMQRLYARQLATNAQLASAKKALMDAQSAFETQKKLGTETAQETVKTPFDAVIIATYASPGDRMPAGKTVLQLAKNDAMRVLIGIQPEDALKVKPGLKVMLIPVFDKTQKLQGAVSEIHGMIDPQTHLVDVIVELDKTQSLNLMVGMKLRGDIEIPGTSEWVVPRAAVLKDEKGAYIFQDDKGQAKRIDVRAIEEGGITAVQGNFNPHLPVVVLGNYELHDGMKLREENR